MGYKTPAELVQSCARMAEKKGAWAPVQMLVLGFMAGAYIAMAGFLYTVVTQDAARYVGTGIAKLLGGTVFPLGLILVVIAGGELFTGNCLMPMGILVGCVPLGRVIKNWAWVFLSNMAGAVAVAFLVHWSGLAEGEVGANALKIAAVKMSLPFGQAMVRGVLCNWLVALAVWMSMAADDVAGKISAIFFPIMGFVASGFEHNVANMYYMALGILVRREGSTLTASSLPADKLSHVNLAGYVGNLLPVTLGNVLGAILFVVVTYFVVFKDQVAGGTEDRGG
ncbi:formate/nitrite transporter [Thermanaerovibrio acidaminovorans DSM 6589]|uniref:Formate/nitrite transporter n=1 Tax=Thermanaerovibrio acidaminovorans (strain ATCC 49978 / DSM 6589 / Su883) TaxID=525903 RepID=D1B7Y8_THEAS|nr:formate/nitrite transporter family protein [Thermanaerovibrio acidaminovorans]ACZ18391.1 formate/nitrite transporter [Thermanaerovibrio acidaminovorans DSM 6589]